ncbi:MarR family transcriptional regulator [Enterobacteriaceae bacterium 4M9]|nr:MarR family transcriptional regulator [Enterobacteriaceae bacterium 4M9]
MDTSKSAFETEPDDFHEHRFRREEYPFFWLVNVQARYSQLLEIELKKIGLDISRFRVLTLAWKYRTATITQLAEYAVIKMPTVTKIVVRLRDDGLVITRASRADGRVTEVLPTEAGVAKAEQAHVLATRIFDRAFKGIRTSQVDKMNLILAQILTNLND